MTNSGIATWVVSVVEGKGKGVVNEVGKFVTLLGAVIILVEEGEEREPGEETEVVIALMNVDVKRDRAFVFPLELDAGFILMVGVTKDTLLEDNKALLLAGNESGDVSVERTVLVSVG